MSRENPYPASLSAVVGEHSTKLAVHDTEIKDMKGDHSDLKSEMSALSKKMDFAVNKLSDKFDRMTWALVLAAISFAGSAALLLTEWNGR